MKTVIAFVLVAGLSSPKEFEAAVSAFLSGR